jgi:hypothetical protein
MAAKGPPKGARQPVGRDFSQEDRLARVPEEAARAPTLPAMSFAHQVAALFEDQGATPEERALIDDAVGGAERQGEGVGVNQTWRLELGQTREGAYFKPVNGVNQTVASL